MDYKVLNTAAHGRIPQNRPRLYIVCLTRKLLESPDTFAFDWPTEVPTPKLSTFLKPNKMPEWIPTAPGYQSRLINFWEQIKEETGLDPSTNMFLMDIGSSEAFGSYMHERCPTLTRSRAGGNGFYMSQWKRMLSTSDMCRLQGFPVSMRRPGCTDRQFRQMLGNAMSVPVLARVFRAALVATAYVDGEETPDL